MKILILGSIDIRLFCLYTPIALKNFYLLEMFILFDVEWLKEVTVPNLSGHTISHYLL